MELLYPYPNKHREMLISESRGSNADPNQREDTYILPRPDDPLPNPLRCDRETQKKHELHGKPIHAGGVGKVRLG